MDEPPGGKTQESGKHTIKPLPKNGFGPPYLRYVSPPPLCSRPVIFLRGNGRRPVKSHFLRPPKLVLEAALYGTFPPPQNRTVRFAPHLRFSNYCRNQWGDSCQTLPQNPLRDQGRAESSKKTLLGALCSWDLVLCVWWFYFEIAVIWRTVLGVHAHLASGKKKAHQHKCFAPVTFGTAPGLSHR